MTDHITGEKLRLLLIKYGQSCYKGFVDPSDLISAIEALGHVEPLSEEEIEDLIINSIKNNAMAREMWATNLAHAIAQAQKAGGRK